MASSICNSDWRRWLKIQTREFAPDSATKLDCFGNLPGEIRNEIYQELIFGEDDQEDKPCSVAKTDGSRFSIAATCRKYRQEAMSWYYSNAHFHLSSSKSFVRKWFPRKWRYLPCNLPIRLTDVKYLRRLTLSLQTVPSTLDREVKPQDLLVPLVGQNLREVAIQIRGRHDDYANSAFVLDQQHTVIKALIVLLHSLKKARVVLEFEDVFFTPGVTEELLDAYYENRPQSAEHNLDISGRYTSSFWNTFLLSNGSTGPKRRLQYPHEVLEHKKRSTTSSQLGDFRWAGPITILD
ncbi:hypothetical protein BU24DRAFT_467804 [Aaosphaeria arxii CBS 175.79]|uniref:F-box domain-containing protein n=1 Tax=Aaosphaeria arxii CBS 175.79 TaxID=1450172 RepID=A0A6A5X8N9_9PLEO|nr:uncharacterized protein BU24DRAFT_467804 [Aaosphaeria arxii CBS 175.79]KAF2009425.1 hypothetical protein BU24DRAFT_467804 [Aaosphaeria arxii CBS 175.79]